MYIRWHREDTTNGAADSGFAHMRNGSGPGRRSFVNDIFYLIFLSASRRRRLVQRRRRRERRGRWLPRAGIPAHRVPSKTGGDAHTLAAFSSQCRFGSAKDACADAREAGERARRLSVPYACQQSAELYLTVGTVLKKARLMASSPSSTLGLDKEFTPLSRLNARVHGFAGRCAALPAMILYTLREP